MFKNANTIQHYIVNSLLSIVVLQLSIVVKQSTYICQLNFKIDNIFDLLSCGVSISEPHEVTHCINKFFIRFYHCVISLNQKILLSWQTERWWLVYLKNTWAPLHNATFNLFSFCFVLFEILFVLTCSLFCSCPTASRSLAHFSSFKIYIRINYIIFIMSELITVPHLISH